MKMPTLGTPTLRQPGEAPSSTEQQAPLPAYAPSLSKEGSAPGYIPSFSAGKLKDPTLDFQMPVAPASSSVVKGNFLIREAFGGLVWWQVILGGVGTLAVTAGLISLVLGGKKR